MPPYRALILDLDGTVLDSHRYTFDAFQYACAGVATPPTDAAIFAAFGPPERVILQRLLPAPAVAPAYARLQEYYAAHASGVGMHAAMRPLLRDCRAAGHRIGLFTGRGGDSTALLLRALDLESCFDAVVAGDTVARPKPAADGVLHLLAALGYGPAETLVVGDSALDLEAAAAAGVAALFAAWHAWSGAAPPAGAAVVSTPDALRPWLGLDAATASLRVPGS